MYLPFFCSLFYDKNPGLGSQIPKLACPMIPNPIPYKNVYHNQFTPKVIDELFYEMWNSNRKISIRTFFEEDSIQLFLVFATASWSSI